MNLKEDGKNEEESELNLTVQEPLELDEQYTKGKDIRWGKCVPFIYRNGIPRIVIGPHWPLFICAFLMFGVASCFLILWHFQSQSFLVRWSTILVCCNQCFSYAWVALINPGVANQENTELKMQKLSLDKKKQAWYCDKCKLVQLIGTVHCYDCDVCVLDMDHHCPWTGKCIGKGNIKQFYYFIGSTLVFMVFNIVISITQLDVKIK